MAQNLTGPFVGTVESNHDPEKLGRVKVSVPHVYGVSDSALGGIGLSDLPWAIPSGLPAGGSAQSGGMSWLPEPGDQVLLFFLDGEPEKPVWMWMMQTIDQAKSFNLHLYEGSSVVGSPKRAALTRYGHTVEFNSGSVIVATRNGYNLLLSDGTPGAFNGAASLSTPKGNLFEFDDNTDTLTLNVTGDSQQVVGGQWLSMSDSIDFDTLSGDVVINSADSFKVIAVNDAQITAGASGLLKTGTGLTITVGADCDATVGGNLNLGVTGSAIASFATLQLGGNSASEPFVRGNQLLELFNILLLWLAGHAHSNGDNGSQTGPPIIAPQPEVEGPFSQLLSETIFGQ